MLYWVLHVHQRCLSHPVTSVMLVMLPLHCLMASSSLCPGCERPIVQMLASECPYNDT